LRNILYIVLICLTFSCSDNSEVINDGGLTEQGLQGTGFFDFSKYEPFADRAIRVYYHIPEGFDENTPIVFLFHGNSRNAFDYRNAMLDKSEEYNFAVIVPRFTSQDFPGGDAYNLGNVYEDGDNPNIAELNPESEWTFSVIEPLFDDIKNQLNSSQNSYHIVGHSAGGQFVHRFMLFKPNARFEKILVSAPGWYTTIDSNVNFPYGLSNSILEDMPLDAVYGRDLTLLVGELDNNSNAGGLRRNSIVDLQGTNRFDRAINFFNQAQQGAMDDSRAFNWQLEINPSADHDYRLAISKAADILFGD